MSSYRDHLRAVTAPSWAEGASGMKRPQIGVQPDDEIVLSLGKEISDPDEAEALGLTVDARRLREAQEWMCPECNDIYGPDDEDKPPLCDMCLKAELKVHDGKCGWCEAVLPDHVTGCRLGMSTAEIESLGNLGE